MLADSSPSIPGLAEGCNADKVSIYKREHHFTNYSAYTIKYGSRYGRHDNDIKKTYGYLTSSGNMDGFLSSALRTKMGTVVLRYRVGQKHPLCYISSGIKAAWHQCSKFVVKMDTAGVIYQLAVNNGCIGCIKHFFKNIFTL